MNSVNQTQNDKSVDDYNHAALLGYLESDVVKSVELLATDDSCTACKKMQGKVITVNDALATQPLPVKECTKKGGCRCCYLPIVDS